VIGNLLELDPTVPVVALTRTPEAIAGSPRLTARYASYEDPSSLRDSLAAVDMLVFISSDGVAEAMRRHHAHVVAAAIEAGVAHIVYMSILDVSPDSVFYYAPVHRETEAILGDSGPGISLARTSIFADYFVSAWVAPALATGTLELPAASGRMSLVSRDDVGRALAALAIRRTTGIAELTGPDALTADEICEITQAATGARLRYEALDDRSYRALMARQGSADWLIEAYSTMFASVRAGGFEAVSADIPELTGAPQRSYAEFVGDCGL
jgi:NAD(P)H dehydrogenase (quinone)